MKKLRVIIILSVAIPVFLVTGCKTQESATIPKVLPIITYEKGKGRCIKCEQYVMTIYDDGTINYDGRANMTLMGVSSFRLGAKDMVEIERQLSLIDMSELEDLYQTKVRDAPIMGITIDGQRVRFQEEVCPKELIELVNTIEGLVPKRQ